MKVLHLSAFLEYSFGGAEQVTRNLIPLLSVDSLAACLDGGSHHLDGIYTVAVPCLTKEGTPWSEWYKRWVMLCQGNGEAKRTADWLMQQQPVLACDLIHCHDYFWVRVAGYLSRMTRKPFIVTCHQNLPFRIGMAGGMGKLINATLAQRDAKRREFLRGASAIVAPSKFCLDSIARFLGLGAPDMLVIPNWLDDDLICAPTTDVSFYDLIYVGRLSQEKGVSVLLDAMNELRDRKLTAIGTGPLEKRVESQPNCRHVPWLEHPMTLSLMGCHEIGVIPSQIDESFGLTAMEYRYMGLKIVSTWCGGVTDVLQGYPNVFWEGKRQPLAGTIRRAMATPWQEDTGRGDFLARYDITTCVEAYQSLYERVLEEHHATATL